MLVANISVAKTAKFASGESGDRVEVIERARGGFSAILVDGQGSGRSAKLISNLVVNKALHLLADGARDGAVARAVHDYLYAVRAGQVSATLTMVSIDTETNSLLLSRNSHCPVYVFRGEECQVFAEVISPIGVHRFMKPEISEMALEENMTIVTFTDGMLDAGKRQGVRITQEAIQELVVRHGNSPDLAQSLLRMALELDQGRPVDDTAVLVVQIQREDADNIKIRHLDLRVPL